MQNVFVGLASKCKTDMEKNAKKDTLNTLSDCPTNQECAWTLFNQTLSSKYDFMDFAVMVYDPVSGFNHHCYWGDKYISFLRFHNKNTVIFYKSKNVKYQVSDETWDLCFKSVEEVLNEKDKGQGYDLPADSIWDSLMIEAQMNHCPIYALIVAKR
jgi:hypothetical protein